MNARFITSAALALYCCSVFADENSIYHTKPNSDCSKNCTNIREPDAALCNIPPAYNIPARITSSCGGATFEVDGSYLYWCIVQDGMDIATTAVLADGGVVFGDTESIVQLPDRYESGFRVGIGTGTTFDDWSLRLEYTYLHRTMNNSFGSNTDVITADGAPIYAQTDWFVLLESDDNPGMSGGSSSWKTNFDALDLALSRPFYQGQRLTITPYTGLFGVSLHQRLNINTYLASDPTTIDFSNNSSKAWGIGPEIGSNFHWLLGNGFRVEADAEFSLLYMSYSGLNHSEFSSVEGTFSGSVPNQGRLRTYYDLSLGLGWGTYFMDNCHFDLSVAYEFVTLPEQNVMRQTAGTLQGYVDAPGDLNFHGLTVSARFDF